MLAAGLPWLAADAQHVGRIDLFLFDQPGTRATAYEVVDGRRFFAGEGVVPPDERHFQIPRARTWRCDRRDRRFEADTTRSDGATKTVSFTVRTPPCHDRMALRLRRATSGRLRVVVHDRWKLGDVTPRLCAGTDCKLLSFDGRERVTTTMPAGRRITLRLGRERWTVAGQLPRLVITGDSTTQNVDTALAEELKPTARVIRAWQGGSSISFDPWNWPQLASEQAAPAP